MVQRAGVADPAVLEVEFRHVHRLVDPAASGVQRWEAEVRVGEERVGLLRVARGLYWRSGNLRERMDDEGSFLETVSAALLAPDGSFTGEFEEAAVDMANNVLVVEDLELAEPWADALIAAALVSSAIDRLSDNGFAVVMPRTTAKVEGAALLDQAGELLAGEEFSEELRIIDTALAAPEHAAYRVQQRLESRSRNGGRSLDEDWDDEEDWGEDEEWKLTERTRAVLRLACEDLSNAAWAEVAALGDEALTARSAGLLASLPRVTFRQGGQWRRQMARAFDDLAGDLAAGRDVVPGCTGEEMALHLVIRRARGLQRDRPRLVADAVAELPAARGDFDWEACSDLMFEDHDVLMLFDDSLDGIEDAGSEVNQALGMVNLAPLDWFTPFDTDAARDPKRGFRHTGS